MHVFFLAFFKNSCYKCCFVFISHPELRPEPAVNCALFLYLGISAFVSLNLHFTEAESAGKAIMMEKNTKETWHSQSISCTKWCGWTCSVLLCSPPNHYHDLQRLSGSSALVTLDKSHCTDYYLQSLSHSLPSWAFRDLTHWGVR